MTVDFNYPQVIDADTPAVAAEVQANFDALLSWIKVNYRQKDDTPQLTVMPTLPGVPVNDQHAATKAYVDLAVPVSTILEFAGATLPNDTWLWCDGAAYSVTAEPALYNEISTLYNTGGEAPDTFRVPLRNGKVGVGFDATAAPFDVQGHTGGQRDGEMLAHEHVIPSHNHAATGVSSDDSHAHTAGGLSTNNTGAHGHGQGSGTRFLYNFPGSGGGLAITPAAFELASSWVTTGANAGAHAHTLSGSTGSDSHDHIIGVTVTAKAAFDTSKVGAGTTLVDKNLQPYIVMRYIIKAR